MKHQARRTVFWQFCALALSGKFSGRPEEKMRFPVIFQSLPSYI